MATLEGLQPEFRERLHALLYEAGGALVLNSGFRSRAEQQRLYDGWVRRLPGYFPANKPGTSMHEKGLAADVDDKGGRYASLRRTLVEKYGFHCPIKNEPWHLELRSNRVPFRPIREAKPLQITTKVVGPFTRVEVDVPSLDDKGCGWVALPGVRFDRVTSVIAQGPWPKDDGYWNTPVFGAQDRDGGTVVSVTEGPPSGRVVFYVWVLN